ncbi:hypothetical protein OIV83_003750 [Microbotryomycetes sp. JL201]|nr:hypothetical protein OIV83_003750 [Microbotryomycetes sp. JL201]
MTSAPTSPLLGAGRSSQTSQDTAMTLPVSDDKHHINGTLYEDDVVEFTVAPEPLDLARFSMAKPLNLSYPNGLHVSPWPRRAQAFKALAWNGHAYRHTSTHRKLVSSANMKRFMSNNKPTDIAAQGDGFESGTDTGTTGRQTKRQAKQRAIQQQQLQQQQLDLDAAINGPNAVITPGSASNAGGGGGKRNKPRKSVQQALQVAPGMPSPYVILPERKAAQMQQLQAAQAAEAAAAASAATVAEAAPSPAAAAPASVKIKLSAPASVTSRDSSSSPPPADRGSTRKRERKEPRQPTPPLDTDERDFKPGIPVLAKFPNYSWWIAVPLKPSSAPPWTQGKLALTTTTSADEPSTRPYLVKSVPTGGDHRWALPNEVKVLDQELIDRILNEDYNETPPKSWVRWRDELLEAVAIVTDKQRQVWLARSWDA